MKLIDEYFLLDKQYKDLYGNKTFLLYQVGSFFEVYGTSKNTQNINRFSEICGLAVSNKKICVGGDNVLMGGFRDYLLDKYIEKIYPYGYSCVVYIQEEQENGTIIRKKHKVYSPGTTFLEKSNKLSNNISCIWIQKVKTLNKEAFIFGLSNIDIFNGTSNLCEYYENYYHNPTTYDCIERFLNIYNPIEVLFIHNIEEEHMKNIMQFLTLNSNKKYVIDLNNDANNLTNQALNCESQHYQDEIIKTFFPSINIEVFKYNICDKPIGLQSYCFLLNFVQQHNVSLVEKIEEPNVEHIQKSLVCANHSFKQLNFIKQDQTTNNNTILDNDEDNKIDSVLSLLNQCKTKMGKRYMNSILLNPLCCEEPLLESYNAIEHYIKKKYTFNEELRQIKDLDKFLTKLKLHKLNPNDIFYLYDNSLIIDKIYKKIKKDKFMLNLLKYEKVQENHENFKKYLNTTFDINIIKHVFSNSFEKYEEHNHLMILKDNFPKLDNQIKLKMECFDKLKSILSYLESCFNKKTKDTKSDFIKQHQPSNSELCLIVTNKRSEILINHLKKQKNDNKNVIILEFNSSYSNKNEVFEFDTNDVYFKSYNKTSSLLCSKSIDMLISNIYNDNILFLEILKDSYDKILKHILHNYYQHILNVIYFLKNLDKYNNFVYLAKTYNLCKPNIQPIKDNKSYVNAKKMRHILIENIDKNEVYVPNDICLGSENTNLGMLLFGTNAVGKTSLIKALGICIIMAQCGCYVPCESFHFFPYKYIFTRIIGNDNIFKGLSTFGVEMSELRVILNNCNENSLILGDELCSGTEIDSALSIFMGSLEIMTKKQSTFIFATHFHELPELKELKELNSIIIKHLKVAYNHAKDMLVYDRKLQDGPGESIYGLEVCKSLNMNNDFLNRCYDIRNKYINNKNNILLMKTSKHNKTKIRNICEFCNVKIGTEIHHLQYQKDANHNDYIHNSFHKNHPANLASICEECHQKIHSLNLIYERRKTINGNYEFVLKKK